MECVEAALKTSFRREMPIKFSPQAFSDDLYTFNMQNVTSSDDFIVDELFDFSNEEQELVVVEEDDEEEEEDNIERQPKPSTAVPEQQQPPEDDKISLNISNFAAELSVPADDLASLEWLSHFVEDSNSEYSTPFPAGISHAKPPKEEESDTTITTVNINLPLHAPQKQVSTETFFKIPIPAKARSKRSRTGVRVWPRASPSLTESSSSCSSPSSSSNSFSSSSSPASLVFTAKGMNREPHEPVCFEKPLVKKPKKRFPGQVGSSGGGSHLPRRCSHCGVQKTPQWRTGPLGAKTLCNACGVRFKSGRLLPEYRPACSPTFSSELHSNHHRKVLEMRKKKETLESS